jgi:glycosyltransferase involved in cell wall biosynthesis
MTFKVKPLTYYKLIIKLKKKIVYKSGSLLLKDGQNRQIFPTIKLPNILFSTVKKESINSIDELNELTDFVVYFKTHKLCNLIKIDVEKVLCDVSFVSISVDVFNKSVDLVEFRNKMDFRFTNYYLNKFFLKTKDQYFINNTNAYNTMLQDQDCFDNIIKDMKVNIGHIGPVKELENKIRVLYLIDMSPQYESIGYTVRTHDMLKHVNEKPDIKVTGCTRLMYPFNRPIEYFDINKVNDEYEADGVKYIKLLKEDNNINNYDIIEYLKMYTAAVIKEAFRLRVNVIHAATDYYNGVACLYAARFLGIKSVYEVRGFWEESSIAYNSYVFDSDTVNLRSKMENSVCSKVDQVLTINEGLQNKIKDRSGRDADIICNGIDLTKVKPDEDIRGELRQKLGISYECTVVGYIGSLLVYEGLDYLLEVISKINNIKFVFAGKGPELDNLFKKSRQLGIQDRVIYLGVLSHEECIRHYNIIDVVAYPRRGLDVCKFTSSSKMFEAMAMQKALLVSDLPANREVITDGINGLFCEPDDVDDLYNKLCKLVYDDDLRVKLSKSAREYVIENRDWITISDNLVKVYKRLFK